MYTLVKRSTFIRQNLLLILIILISAILRFGGIYPGFPPIHSDEGVTHTQALAMILEHSLNPIHGYSEHYTYGIVVPLINAVFFLIIIPISFLWNSLIHFDFHISNIFYVYVLGQNHINIILWSRLVTALFGIGVVYLTYIFCKNFFKYNLISCLAAFFVAINYREVLNSHIGLVDIYNGFFLLLSLTFTLKLWQNFNKKNLILAVVFSAIFFSVKFQLFAIPPLILVLIFLSFKEKNLKRQIRFLTRNISLIILVIILISTALNIFHLLNWQTTVSQLSYTALKYRYGRMALDFYPISYLYHFGIGSTASLLFILGSVLLFIKDFRNALFIFSVIIPFFFEFAFFTGGGFYTRNLVAIIPIILMISAFAIVEISQLVGRKWNLLLLISLLLIVSYQSLKDSMVVPIEYSKKWNFLLTQRWVGQNIPSDSKIMTEPSVLIPVRGADIVYSTDPNDYNLSKIQARHIDWVVINLNYFSNSTYWWMVQDTAGSLRYWDKPTNILMNTQLARNLEALKPFIAYESLNPWQAPDENFLVIKIPRIGQVNTNGYRSQLDLNEHLFLNSNSDL